MSENTFKKAQDYYSGVLSVVDSPRIDFTNNIETKCVDIVLETPRYIDTDVELYLEVYLIGKVTTQKNTFDRFFYYGVEKSAQDVVTQTTRNKVIKLDYDEIMRACKVAIGIQTWNTIISKFYAGSDTFEKVVADIKHPQLYVAGYAVIDDNIVQPSKTVEDFGLLDSSEDTEFRGQMKEVVKSRLKNKDLSDSFNFIEKLITLDNISLAEKLDKSVCENYRHRTRAMKYFDILEIKKHLL